MKPGDLVRRKDCQGYNVGSFNCECWVCSKQSSRVGIITGPGPRNSWLVMFDCGEWRIYDFEEARGSIEVINES